MKFNKKSLLIKLLEKGITEQAKNCLLALQNEFGSDYISTEPIPINEVIDIASKRAKAIRKRKKKIFGFDSLLPVLEQTEYVNVIVHRVKDDKNFFDVFTDDQIKDLLGIITID